MQRLISHQFQFESKHIRGEKAGHHIYYPDFIPGIDMGVNGGEAKAKVKWSLVVWQETLNFLDKHLCKDPIAPFPEILMPNLSGLFHSMPDIDR
jgi:hypothetical protein